MKKRLLCAALAVVMAAFMSIPATVSADTSKQYSWIDAPAETTITQGEDLNITIGLKDPLQWPIAGQQIYYYIVENGVPHGLAYSPVTDTNGQVSTIPKEGEVPAFNIASKLTPGTYTIRIEYYGNDEYRGSLLEIDLIVVAAPPDPFNGDVILQNAAISKLTRGKKGSKKLTVKMSKPVSETGGEYYQIQYRIKGKTKWNSKTTKKQSLTLSKLTKGKVYQVRARACKKVGTKTYYSAAWTKKKTSKKIR